MRRKRTPYVLMALLLPVVLCIATGWSDVVLNPWARSLNGGPVLIGTWRGEVPVPDGGVRAIVLHLERPPSTGTRRCGSCPDIEGWARMCRPGGQPDEFGVSGDPRNWRGTVFRLEAGARDRAPGRYTGLGRLEGEWDGGDTIRLRATPYAVVINADGSSTTISDSRSPDPEVTFELRRAQEGDPRALPCP